MSTVHTNDAPSTIVRLIDMGVKPYLVSTSVVGIVAQRLVRKICSNCKTSYEASEQEKKILGKDLDEKVTLFKGEGCGYCHETGYTGRIGIYEIMEMTREHRKLINEGADSDMLRDISVKNGLVTLEEECRELVLKGITTVEELSDISTI